MEGCGPEEGIDIEEGAAEDLHAQGGTTSAAPTPGFAEKTSKASSNSKASGESIFAWPVEMNKDTLQNVVNILSLDRAALLALESSLCIALHESSTFTFSQYNAEEHHLAPQ